MVHMAVLHADDARSCTTLARPTARTICRQRRRAPRRAGSVVVTCVISGACWPQPSALSRPGWHKLQQQQHTHHTQQQQEQQQQQYQQRRYCRIYHHSLCLYCSPQY
eukprot:COSAG05_NODE_77_length_21410_cov_1079.308573_8_plen_107_part_00